MTVKNQVEESTKRKQTPHKPGPWTIVTGDADRREMSRIIAEPGEREHLIGYVLREWVNPHQQAEDDANARLIAAAPELFESLEALTAWGRTYCGPRDAGNVHELLINAVAALAKAKGE